MYIGADFHIRRNYLSKGPNSIKGMNMHGAREVSDI